MKLSAWIRFRISRSILISVAFLIYILFALLDTTLTFPYLNLFTSSAIITWLDFGFSLSVALIFLAIGSLIWFYSYDRRVASLIFIFSCAAMIAFELETAASITPSVIQVPDTISGVASSTALTFLALTLFIFPQNHFFTEKKKANERSFISQFMIRGYIFSLCLALCLVIINVTLNYILFTQSTYNQTPITYYVSDVLSLVGSIITVVISFQSSSIREREQLRFFVIGVLLALTPLLLLTVIPLAFTSISQAFTSISRYEVDARITTLTVVLLPLSLGYAILRYQILVLDSYIRRTVSRIIGILLLVMLAYIEYVLYVVLREMRLSMYTVITLVIITAVVLAPTVWSLARLLTERVIFKESLHYRRLLEEPVNVGREVVDLDGVGQLITEKALQTFKTTQVALFVLVEETGYFKLFPKLQDEQNEAPRRVLATRCISALSMNSLPTETDQIELSPYVEQRLFTARRPLFLYEVTRAEADMPIGLSRYLTSASPDEQSAPLVAPIRSQGKMIAFFILGERPDKQSYAGPDFDIVELLLSRYSSLLNTAQLQERSRQHAALLNDLYKTGTITIGEAPNLESITSAYAKVAAEATGASVEIWLYNEQERVLEQKASIGIGTSLLSKSTVQFTSEDWRLYYYVGTRAYSRNQDFIALPPCLVQKPQDPFAWIPLKRGERRQGVLILNYHCSHLFLAEEMHVLEMFAEQCTAAIENTYITMELRSAYEHQRELDILKDKFIITASHELRTPLTAVLGYLELLKEYHGKLKPTVSANFIARAYRGCEELALMVNNIMDANYMDADYIAAEGITKKIVPTSLNETVNHIVEIVETLTTQDNHVVTVAIAKEIHVLADVIRLQQVLLNLINNAVKYSLDGTPILISAVANAMNVTIAVRDYGFGIPKQEQGQLFERFFRLERDMNSPRRGAGLGLYISRQLIKSMGGMIWFESTGCAGEGSTFFFTLPLVPSQA